jgi:hypothetical protein
MGTTGGLGGPTPGLGATVAGSEAALTGPEDELTQIDKGTEDDGTAVGEADREADVRGSGADDAPGRDDSAGTGTSMPVTGDAPDSAAVEDGEPIGAADRDADIERSM